MKRKNRLIILLVILVLAVGVTVGVSMIEEEREAIAESGEVVLEIPTESVTALAWEYEDTSLSFTLSDGVWNWDDDPAFPVDEESVETLLSQFSALAAAFVIEDVTDYGQYGLDDPLCVINITAYGEEYTINVGDYSTLDYQRYISFGDGNVYLVNDDPMDYYDATLDDMMLNDSIPNLVNVTRVNFTGAENYEIVRDEEGNSYLEDDVYYTDASGETTALDKDKVNSYVQYISGLSLTDYVTYDVTDDELAEYGLDDPELTVTIDYPDEETDESETFTISFSRSATDKLTDWDDVLAAMEAEESDSAAATEEPTDEEAVAYVRVEDSSIIYEISYDTFSSIMEASYDDLRHTEVLQAEFEDVQSLDITIGGETYELTTIAPAEEKAGETDSADSEESTDDSEESSDDSEAVWYYQDQEDISISDVESAMTGLNISSFTSGTSHDEAEISLTVTLSLEGNPQIEIVLYRIDGTNCLAAVDGEEIGLVARTDVVELIEAVNAIILG